MKSTDPRLSPPCCRLCASACWRAFDQAATLDSPAASSLLQKQRAEEEQGGGERGLNSGANALTVTAAHVGALHPAAAVEIF